ncbi:TetR/AcrR family transcriptional regulator [Lactobacillus intestinalis]|uniref:TetR/AcrR family transcriptional regulator n=1 Tax=Lactobacillus intestinalis TaxID=151781 RepID=UPI0002CA924D|nr:TetR/AcrR family transcriptional regulator [Lactobacillus intestinalis]KAI4308724.1 hypothetical protein C821_000390 [Lactobacillus intestinalis]
MKYSKSQRKRILNTAISIIEKDGIDKLTIRELVKKTNVGTQSVYKHFPNKDELIKTIASKLTTDYLDEVNKSALLNPKEKLIHSASFFLKKTSEHPHLMDFLFFNPKIENILPKNTVNIPTHFIGRINSALNVTQVKEDRQELFLRIWAIIHGLAMMIKNGLLEYTPALAQNRLASMI